MGPKCPLENGERVKWFKKVDSSLKQKSPKPVTFFIKLKFWGSLEAIETGLYDV